MIQTHVFQQRNKPPKIPLITQEFISTPPLNQLYPIIHHIIPTNVFIPITNLHMWFFLHQRKSSKSHHNNINVGFPHILRENSPKETKKRLMNFLPIWEAEGASQNLNLSEPYYFLMSVARGYRGCICAGVYQTISLWDPKRGKNRFTVTSARNHYGFRYVHSAESVAIGTDSEVLLVSLKNKSILRTYSNPTSYVWNLDVVEDRPLLIMAGDGTGKYSFYNQKKCLKSNVTSTVGVVRGVCKLYRKNHTACTVTASGYVDFYNYKKFKSEKITGQGQLYTCKEDNFRDIVVCGGYNVQRLKIYDIRNLRSKVKETSATSGYVWGVGVMPDQQKILGGTQSGMVDIFDLRKLSQKLNSFKAHTSQIYRFRRMSSGEIATCGADRTIRTWNISGGRLTRQWKKLKDVTLGNVVYGMAYIHPERIGHGLKMGTTNVTSHAQIEEQERIDYFMDQYPEQFEASFDIQLENKLVEFWKCFLLENKYIDLTHDEEEENEGEEEDDDDNEEEEENGKIKVRVDKECDQVELPLNLQIDEKVLVRVLFCMTPPNYRRMEGFHEIMFLDYYKFYQTLGLKSGMYHIFYQILSMDLRNPEWLFMLFVQCIKKFENNKIKRMFLKKKKKRVLESLEELVQEEVEWASTFGQEGLAGKDSSKYGREGRLGKASLALVREASTSLFLFLYNLIKVKQERIKKNSEMLKLFLPLLDGVNRYPFQDFLQHKDFNIDWESFKSKIDKRKEHDEEDDEERRFLDFDDDDDDDSDEEKDDAAKLLQYFVIKRYRRELEHLSLSQLMKSKKFWNVGLTTKGDEKTVFQTFKEVLVLKSPFFYRMSKFPGAESEMMRVTGSLRLDYVNKYMLCLMIHFYFLGRIPLKSNIPTTEHGDLLLDFDGNSMFLIALFRLLNYCDMYEDINLREAVYNTFGCVFRNFRSRFKIINMIVSYGYILESEKVQAQFCSNLCEICSNVMMKYANDDSNSSNAIQSFDEEMMKRYIKESHRKFSVDVSIRKWRKRLNKVKKEKRNLKFEIENLKKKMEDLSQVKKKKKKKKKK